MSTTANTSLYGDFYHKTSSGGNFNREGILDYLNQLDKMKFSESHEKKIIEMYQRHELIFSGELSELDESLPLHVQIGLRQGIYEKCIENNDDEGMIMITQYPYVRVFLEECERRGVHKFYEFGYGDRRAVEIVEIACRGLIYENLHLFLNAMSAYGYEHLYHLLLCCSYFMDYHEDRDKRSKVMVNLIKRKPGERNVNIENFTYDVGEIFSTIMIYDYEGLDSTNINIFKSPESEISHLYETGKIFSCSNMIKYGANKKKAADIIYIAWKELPYGSPVVGGIETDRERVNPVLKSISDPLLLYTDINLDISFNDERRIAYTFEEKSIFSSLVIPRERHVDRISFLEREFFEKIVVPEERKKISPRHTALLHRYILINFHDYYHEVYEKEPFIEIVSSNQKGLNYLRNDDFLFYLRENIEKIQGITCRMTDDITDYLKISGYSHNIGETSLLDRLIPYTGSDNFMIDDIDTMNRAIPAIMYMNNMAGAWMKGPFLVLGETSSGSILDWSPLLRELYGELCTYARSFFNRNMKGYHLYIGRNFGYKNGYTVYLMDINAPTEAIIMSTFAVVSKRVVPISGRGAPHITDRFTREISPLFNAMIHNFTEGGRPLGISEGFKRHILLSLIPPVSSDYSRNVPYASK